MTGALREIAGSFVAAAPAGARVRTRLRVSAEDEAMLWAVGRHLGSLAGRDLAARCAEGRLDAKGEAVSRAARKRALTAECSSRWAGAITRTSEDAYQLAERNLRAEQATLTARIRAIEARLTVPAGGETGRTRGYATPAERHAKTIRLKALKARLVRVRRRLDSGAVSVARGGKALLRKRNNLAAAGLTEARWRREWESSRLFLTADGEKSKPWGNETIRWNADAGWLELKLPAPLAQLANRPHGRYRLSCLVGFPYRGDEVAAQAATGPIRYDISHDPGLPAATRDGRLRAVISALIATAKEHDARSIVIEDLDFAEARAEGRERAGSRPSRGRRGRGFRRAISGIPTRRFRDRLTQMACNARLSVIVVDPAYTSRWGAEHWLAPLREHHPNTTGHHAAALVIGRRGLGHRARRRATGNQPAPAEAARPAQTRPRTQPATKTAPRKPATPPGPRQPPGTKTGRPHRTSAGTQAAQDRSAPPAESTHHHSATRNGAFLLARSGSW